MGIGITPSSVRAHRDTTVDEPPPDSSAIPREYDDRPTTADVALPEYALEHAVSRDSERRREDITAASVRGATSAHDGEHRGDDDAPPTTRGPTTARGHAAASNDDDDRDAPGEIEDGATSDGTPSGEMTAASRTDDDATNPHISAPAPRRAGIVASQPSPGDSDDDATHEDPEDADDSDVVPPPPPSVSPSRLSASRQIDYDPVDDGWGPPGTTIPPPLLGAIPGSDDDVADGAIPMPNMDSAPLMVAPPSPPEPTRSSPGIPLDKSGQSLVNALEMATSRAIDLIRLLEHARDRDEVVAGMIAHLAETHRRAGFFSIKSNPAKVSEMSLFQMTPKLATIPAATLRLDRPSTLQDVVGTRLPYRGPMHDDASRTFLTSVLGACPAEILLVPVTVRERVVGVLFGEHRVTHTFDDQLALAARAAGMALERILKSKRG